MIKINNIEVPIVKDNDEIYYPVTYISEKVLLRTSSILTKNNIKKVNNYIKTFSIDFNFCKAGIQNTKCMTASGFETLLKKNKIGRLSTKQLKALNKLLKYFNMETINEKERFIKSISKYEIQSHNKYVQDCIEETLKYESNIVWQKCTKCNKYYPYDKNYFRNNLHSSKEYNTVCMDCEGYGIKLKNNEYLSKIYFKYGCNIYSFYKNHNIIEIYNHYLHDDNQKHIPKIIHNKDEYYTIIRYLFDIAYITNDNLTLELLEHKYKITNVSIHIDYYKLYEYLFGNEPVNYSWHFKNFRLNYDITTIENAKTIFKNYIKEKNINLENIFDCNYNILLSHCGLISYINSVFNKDTLGFIIQLYDNKYPPYIFKGGFINHWKSKENRIKALKYLIEEDMKLPIDKIPLYLTIMSIRNIGGATMYDILKKYYKNLYYWVDEVYPNYFIESDFNINIIRNEFDSVEESMIYDILINKFENVIYNNRNSENTVKLNGMIPDWVVFTDAHVYIIEYFGISLNRTVSNKRISDYQEKTKRKISKYDKLKYYEKIYLYPDDLKNNYEGLNFKLDNIK
jgi:hypothetical protein